MSPKTPSDVLHDALLAFHAEWVKPVPEDEEDECRCRVVCSCDGPDYEND